MLSISSQRFLNTVLIVLGSANLSRASMEGFRIPETERNHEAAWLRALGFRLPDSGTVLEFPYSLPLSTRTMILPSSWFSRDLPENVSADALVKDLDVLQIAMQKAYGGWELADSRGWDWNAWFKKWRLGLKQQSGKSLGVNEAFLPYAQLKKFQPDNHSHILTKAVLEEVKAEGSQTALLATSPTVPCQKIVFTDRSELLLNSYDRGQQPKRVGQWKKGRPAGICRPPGTPGSGQEVVTRTLRIRRSLKKGGSPTHTFFV